MDCFFPIFWFYKVFGWKEAIGELDGKFSVEEDGDMIVIKSNENGRTFTTGRLDLRRLSSFEEPCSETKGRLSIVKGSGSLTSPPQWTDMYFAFNHDDFDGATFQQFTAFNCLPVRDNLRPEEDRVTSYVFDGSAAGQAAVVTGPSTIWRCYFVPHGDGQVGQAEMSLNMLSETPLPMDDGVVFITELDVKELEKVDFRWDDLDNYQIGVQNRCSVVVAKNVRMMEEVPTGKEVNQVFCSALCFTCCERTDFTEMIALRMLEAQYKATILAACENAKKYPHRKGSNKLFLQLLGFDVIYDNDLWMLEDAIRKCQTLIEDSGLDVYLVSHNKKQAEPVVEALGDLVHELGGSIIETKRGESEEDMHDVDCACCKYTGNAIVVGVVGLVVALVARALWR